MATNEKPLVYSCSGCSNLAQTANHLAVTLNAEQKAEMSCIAGVGGNVPSLVKKAKSGRRIIAIDGCHLACVKACLGNHGVTPEQHLVLTEYGYKKRYNQPVSQDTVDDLLIKVRMIAEEMSVS
ncbi:MAG TPA: putative zinc-binding protein [Kangiella sp.]